MKRLTILFALALILGVAAIGARAEEGAVNGGNLNQKIAAAKSAADHEAIALYYDNEAAENEKMVSLHRVSKNIYSKSNNQLHCNNLIKAYEQAVSEDKELAAMHRQMAKEASRQSGQ